MASSEGTPANTAAISPGASANAAARPSAGADSSAAKPGPFTEDRRESSGSQASEGQALIAEEIRVSCLMNARYHATREGFLDEVHRWFMFAVIALGAGALVDIGVRELPWAKEAFAACAAIIAALDLTFDLSNRARTHAMMKRRYFELLADFGENKRTAQETRACINRFGADEEPVYHALLAEAWNDSQEMVYGDDAYRYHVPPWHHWSRNFLRHGVKYEVFKGPKVSASQPAR